MQDTTFVAQVSGEQGTDQFWYDWVVIELANPADQDAVNAVTETVSTYQDPVPDGDGSNVPVERACDLLRDALVADGHAVVSVRPAKYVCVQS